jgi:hypothetical protein
MRFVKTWVLCAYCPRRIFARDGQQSETLTKKFFSVVPCATSCCFKFGINSMRSALRSSVRIKIILGVAGCAVPRRIPPRASRETATMSAI